MNTTQQMPESLEEKVMVTITQREKLLLQLCLGLVDQEHARGSALSSDIQNLQSKLSGETGGR